MSATEHFFDVVRQLDAQTGHPALKKVDIYAANIGDAGSLRLAASIKRNYSLQILNAGSNCIGDEGGTAIAQALEKNTTLHTLRLHENAIGNEAVFCFGRALKCNISLRVLDLSANAIYDDGAIALAHALKTKPNSDSNCSLTALHLSSNHIGNAGAMEFSHVLRSNSSFRLLDLSHCRISDAGGAAFAQALLFNTHLQTLNLSFNGLSHVLGNQFVTALKHRSELLKLVVEGQGILDDALALIKALGPKPPPPPTKWVRPAAQGELEALAARHTEMQRNASSIKSSKLQTKSKAIANAARFVRASSPWASHSGDNTTFADNESGALTRLDSEFKDPCLSGELRKSVVSGSSNLFDQHCDIDSSAVTALASKVNQMKLKSKTINNPAKMMTANSKPAIRSESTTTNDPDKTVIAASLDPEAVMRSAQIKASVIVADAQAIATDMLLEAQKLLQKVIASKAKPVSFEVAHVLETEVEISKTSLGSSKLHFPTKNEASIGFLDSPKKSTSPVLSHKSVYLNTKEPICDNIDVIDAPKPTIKPTGERLAPLGFQKCKLAEELAVAAAHTASLMAAEANAAAIAAAAVAAEASAAEASPLQNFRAQLRSFSVTSIGGYGSCTGIGLFDIDSQPLVHEPIQFVSLQSLPFLEVELLPELRQVQGTTTLSIHHNDCSIEVTGPLWCIKMGETHEIDGLPEHFAVKQFFEEIQGKFHEDFALYNSIQGRGIVPITHVLSSGGVPVGLVMEYFPLSLDTAMHSMTLMDAISVLAKCAAALHSLHLSGISHSNISTSAFLISNDFCTVKLAEFAIDQCLLSSLGFVHRQEPFFAAPECSNGDNAPSVLTDVYAFGALIWRVLHPLNQLQQGNTPIAASLAAARGTLPSFTRIGIPACISDICHYCMAADPKVRPQTLSDVVPALLAAQDMIVDVTPATIGQLLGNGKECHISCLSGFERAIVPDGDVDFFDENLDGEFATFVLSRARGSEEERNTAAQVQSFFVKFSVEKEISKTSNISSIDDTLASDQHENPTREVFEISRISRVTVPSDREAHW